MISQLNNIRELVSNNKIEAALDALLALSRHISDKKLKNEVLLNCSNYKKSYRDTLLNLSENNTSENKSVMLILEFVDEIEELYLKNKSIYNLENETKKMPFFSFILKIGNLNISVVFALLGALVSATTIWYKDYKDQRIAESEQKSSKDYLIISDIDKSATIINSNNGYIFVDTRELIMRKEIEGNPIHFRFNSSEINASELAKINNLITYCKTYKECLKSITLIGCTDTLGEKYYNKLLSCLRVENVTKQLGRDSSFVKSKICLGEKGGTHSSRSVEIKLQLSYKCDLSLQTFPHNGYVQTQKGSYLGLRSRPSEEATMITKLPNNASVIILGYDDHFVEVKGEIGKWCKVLYNGKIGWVWGKFIVQNKNSEHLLPENAF